MIAALTPFLLMLGPVALLVVMGIVFAETVLLVGFFLPGLLAVGLYVGGVPLIASHIELFALGMVALSLIPALVGVVRHRSARRNNPPQHGEPVAPASPVAPRVPVGAP